MTSTSPSNEQAPLIIVGAGQAGAMAARALRESGYAGRLLLIGDERHAPYERPPLSKAVLSEPEPPALDLLPTGFPAEQGMELLTGRRVARLDPQGRRIQLDDGAWLPFRACLLATGGQVRTLPALPPGTPGVHYLRTLDDALRLRQAMRTADRMLVIGGGFLGLEVASTARAQGMAVTLVEQAPMLLGRAVPPEVSAWLAGRAAAYGIDLRLDARIGSLEARDGGVTAVLADGETLRAPLAVVSVGLVPEVALAQAAGLVIDARNGGVLVDAGCRSSAPGIYAAGDCASRREVGSDAGLRLESWQNANEQARIAAAAMLGVETHPAPQPWFWTDQFDCNIQMMGHGGSGTRYVARGDLSPGRDGGKALIFGVRDGLLAQLIAINAGGDLRAFRDLVGKPLACAPEALGDAAIPAKQLARLALGQARS
ncbi:Rhodocoxin reductase [Pigmentiphaga humi]|uniref:Rhodocoxin reductase n=1 Tax=Pigmentiphaga humi TaxID=2478468 RepID=A0A3P4AYZ1_9BURK|nr:FAD-dependent oxidoreductase [Pigmentiphaga humi]VCU68618.1 Rhodocoxin reductase [Pigmentiphaga humi]